MQLQMHTHGHGHKLTQAGTHKRT